ncbi:MAG: undecaprenyl/decaprenyl-phosphate alpha-N-acetylglucosaminyl 1-phosphate transferase [Oscillospiraceae bacterium]|jgi:UDP-GlcNAc:undecaprenyl-phosphate GlcNAc-1-phosphate transferase|nr:undecaprenyl/decaprenyl-phosphate alpha-N-acetylglucosaminyl 1-phosphate transferase [Oscillospiraceae bacterium]
MVLDSEFIVRLLYTIVVAAGISCAITPLVKRLAKKVGAMDIPKDHRRMHHKPIPRMGGLSIFLAFLISFLIFGEMDRGLRGILLGATVIVILGITDDIKTLRALPKFGIQILAAVLVVIHGCRIEQFLGWELPVWFSCIATVIWIVMITNAVNFIDGLDGLAAGVSAISAGTMLIVALMLVPEHNATLSALVLAAILGGCIGFIPYNFNPASIFMGDTGSTFLGFMLASVSVFGLFKTYAVISFAVPFLVLGLPIFDICFAVIRRLAKGQSPMHADRGHVHHRLIDMGFSQKQAVAISYLISVMLGLCAVVLTDKGEVQALIFLAALVLVGSLGLQLFFIKRHHNHHKEQKEETENEEN